MIRFVGPIKITIAGICVLSVFAWLVNRFDLPLLVAAALVLFAALSLQLWIHNDTAVEDSNALGDGTKSDRSTRSRSLIIANLGADIRGPLQSILSVSDEVMVSELTFEQRKNISRIRENAEALDELLNNALDFAAIDAGRLKLNPVNFVLRDTLRELLAPYAQLARTQSRQVSRIVQVRVPDGLTGDVERLQNVLLNLLQHIGVQSTANDIEVRVSLDAREENNVDIRFVIAGGNMAATVSTIEAFVADFESGAAELERQSVTDLALALTIQMIGLLGGKLEVDRAIPTTPKIAFTARFGMSTAPPQATVERSMLGLIPDLPVLVVHPDDGGREKLVDMLIGWQTDPTCVDRGDLMRNSMESARRTNVPYGLLIVSATLDDEDGMELCRQLQAHQEYSSVPRIPVSYTHLTLPTILLV